MLLRLLNINMGSFVFKWEHAASEVYVTGTFDNWSKSEKLIQTGDVFEKNVTLPSAAEKIYYKVRGVTMNCYKLFQRVELRHQVGREGSRNTFARKCVTLECDRTLSGDGALDPWHPFFRV